MQYILSVNGARRDSIILFDGVCRLCDGLVDFVMGRDASQRFKFAPLQSSAGRELLRHHGLSLDDLDTFVLIENGRAYTRSTAALRVLRHLPAPWPLAHVFFVVPLPIRDAVYGLIASNRHRMFGKRQTCRTPTPGEQKRFI